MTALIVHVPHASVLIPEHALIDYSVDAQTLAHELLRLTDWYTDELFANGFPNECVARAEVSRLVIDAERFVDDEQEACSQVGMGATYTKTSDGVMLRHLSPTRREQLLAQYYWPHHHRLDQMTEAMLARHGRCVILDAHSFPTQALPTQVDFGTPPEIGIGTDALHTSKALREFAEPSHRLPSCFGGMVIFLRVSNDRAWLSPPFRCAPKRSAKSAVSVTSEGSESVNGPYTARAVAPRTPRPHSLQRRLQPVRQRPKHRLPHVLVRQRRVP